MTRIGAVSYVDLPFAAQNRLPRSHEYREFYVKAAPVWASIAAMPFTGNRRCRPQVESSAMVRLISLFFFLLLLLRVRGSIVSDARTAAGTPSPSPLLISRLNLLTCSLPLSLSKGRIRVLGFLVR